MYMYIHMTYIHILHMYILYIYIMYIYTSAEHIYIHIVYVHTVHIHPCRAACRAAATQSMYIYIYMYTYVYFLLAYYERWGAGVETQKNVRREIGGWVRVPFNEPYAPSLSTIYDGA